MDLVTPNVLAMTIDVRTGGRDLAAAVSDPLARWVGEAPLSPNLHPGDVGWHLRFADDTLADAFLLWEDGGEPVAVGLAEDTVLRLAVGPGHDRRPEVAEAVAEVGAGFGYVDAFSGTALRRLLLERGWSADPDPWVLLHKELTDQDAAWSDPDTRPLAGAVDVEARTAVQRSAFSPGSTFHPDLWQRMTTGPTYDPRFEMVTWTPDGEPAAAATGWFAGPGRCALLEPVGTHQDHQRRGYGRRVNLGVMAALAAAGASGIRVHTPASNRAAVAAYEACGLRQVEWTTAVIAPR